MKKWLLPLVLLTVTAAGVSWWLARSQPGNTEVNAEVAEELTFTIAEESITGVAPETEPAIAQDEVTETTLRRARRIVHVPDTRPLDEGSITDERQMTVENIESVMQANLDRALQGEMASAYFVARTRMACERFARTPRELERRTQRINRQMERDFERGRESPRRADNWLPVTITGDPQSNRAQMESWAAACQSMQTMFTPDLRLQLETLALGGDVMARYLYATWPLEQLDAGQAFDEQFRWEGLSRDFTQANLDRGEVAGLMAFAQSYLSGWFTDRNSDLALAFAIATTNCGFETSSLNSFLTSRINQLTNSDNPADLQRLQFSLMESDRVGQLCAQ